MTLNLSLAALAVTKTDGVTSIVPTRGRGCSRGWGAVLHDDDLAQAIVDRVLERGRLLRLDGPSMRTRHLGFDDATAAEAASAQLARISGTPTPEFPEPTPAWSSHEEAIER